MRDIHDQTYYELLEIDATATQEEILKAYNRARATYGHNSPALYSLFNKEEAQELLRLIDEAYAVLSNQFKRKQYDSGGTAPKTAPPKTAEPEAPKERRKNTSKPDTETDFAIPSAGAMPEFREPNDSRESDGKSASEPATSPHAPAANVGAAEASQQQISREIRDRRAPKPPPTMPPAAKTETATGAGSTPFGSYTIDPAFEEEIKTAQEFSGTFIQRVRLYKNISLDQICETTKISRPYLIAVEANNFTSLPAPVFVRGFIVQISKLLGIDPTKAATSFIKLLKEAQPK